MRALLVIDVLTHYEFEDGEALAESARGAVGPLRALIDAAGERGVPVVYVNDHHGDWSASADDVVARSLEGRHPELVEPLRPPETAMFLTKTRHSAFYGTPLDQLLSAEGIDHVVLCGQATEQCVLYTALDAHLRHLEVTVAADAVAHIDPELAGAALRMMERNLGARVTDAADALS